MTKAAELIATENIDCDFVDINCGCPIDLLFNQVDILSLCILQFSLYQRININFFILFLNLFIRELGVP